MVEISVTYEGGLRCRAVHGPSGAELLTDAPLDNHGQGQAFSPTDLVATALGTCMLTTMGIVAERHGWILTGARATVIKSMQTDPERRIGRLSVRIAIPGAFDEKTRATLIRTAHTCPVHKSLGAGVEIPVEFVWDSERAPSRA